MAAYLKRTFWLALLSFSVSSSMRLMATVSIGNESRVTTPASAHYSGVLNVRPGHGETVMFNPPTFTWFYATNHLAGGEQGALVFYQTNAFQFQIATQADFGGTLVVDVSTPTSFYNFLAPLNTNATRQFWWRVKYITGGVPYWTNGIYTFTVTNGAANWDRSMLADAGYHATNSHPRFCYRGGEEAAIWSWINSDKPVELDRLVTRATDATNQAYFKNITEWATNATPNPTYAVPAVSDYATRLNDLGAVLFLHRFSADVRWTNASMSGWLFTNLSHVVNWYIHPSNNYAMVDYGQPAGSPQAPRLIAATFDWLYDYLGSDTATFNGQLRTNSELALKYTCRFWTHNNFWSAWPAPPGNLIFMPDWGGQYSSGFNTWDYTLGGHSAPWHGWMKIGTSHATTDSSIAMFASLLIPTESEDGALAFEWFINYMLARTSPYAGFAAHHVGAFGYVDNATYERSVFNTLMLIDVALPGLQTRNIEFLRRFPEWYTRMLPYGQRKYHGPYGDGAPLGAWGAVLGDERRGFDLAAVSRSGLARQAWDLNRQYSNTYSDTSALWDLLPLRYHYRTLPAAETNTTSKVYPEDGYVVASSKSPSEFDCYTNGVGFSMRASPRGGQQQGHNIHHNLAPDMWAYGAQITDGGGGDGVEYPAYDYLSPSKPGLFVNGYGEGDIGFSSYGISPPDQLQASIVNFTNSGTNFVYVCADGTALFTNIYHPERGNVLKVKRHILFVRSLYWVIYDEFATRSNSVFSFRWHVPWVFRYEASPSPLANETEFTLGRIGSNSLAMTTNGFTYVAGNYATADYPNPQRANVHVSFANATNQYRVFNATGTNALGVASTSAIGTANTNTTLNPHISGGKTYIAVNPDRAVGMWVTNTVAATNWHLMTVIVPRQPGVAEPSISRLDDNTVSVTYDGVTETNTFGTNYVGAYTYRVETIGDSSGGSEPGGIRRARAGRVQAVKVIN